MIRGIRPQRTPHEIGLMASSKGFFLIERKKMGFRAQSYIADKILESIQDKDKESIRNMSDKELVELNKVWGRSICHNYSLGMYRVGKGKTAEYSSHLSLEILKTVREKLLNDQM